MNFDSVVLVEKYSPSLYEKGALAKESAFHAKTVIASLFMMLMVVPLHFIFDISVLWVLLPVLGAIGSSEELDDIEEYCLVASSEDLDWHGF